MLTGLFIKATAMEMWRRWCELENEVVLAKLQCAAQQLQAPRLAEELAVFPLVSSLWEGGGQW